MEDPQLADQDTYAESLHVLGQLWGDGEMVLLVCCWLCCSAEVRQASWHEVLCFVDGGTYAQPSHAQMLVDAVQQLLGEQDMQQLDGYAAFRAACLGDDA
jgi:hypothetical protein